MMLPPWIKQFFIAPQPLVPYAYAMLCTVCDVVQKEPPPPYKCLQCGHELLSLPRLFRLQKDHIARLSERLVVDPPKPMAQGRPQAVKGLRIPWDAKLALVKKAN